MDVSLKPVLVAASALPTANGEKTSETGEKKSKKGKKRKAEEALDAAHAADSELQVLSLS